MIPRYIHEKAFAMYCANMIPGKIVKLIGMKNENTIYKWVKNENWEQKREEILQFKEANSIIDDKEREIKLIESVIDLWIEALKLNKPDLLKKVDPKDLFEAIKMRRLFRGESTDNLTINNEVLTVQEQISKIRKQQEEENE